MDILYDYVEIPSADNDYLVFYHYFTNKILTFTINK